jgi:hypothetical protein
MHTLNLNIAGREQVFRPGGIEYGHIVPNSSDHPGRVLRKHARYTAEQPELSDFPYQHLISPVLSYKFSPL